MNKKFIILAISAALLLGTILFLKLTSFGSVMLWNISNEGTWLLPLVAIAALIDSINPCAFSILLLTIAFLISLGKVRGSILTIGAFYILGIYISYVLIGLGILQALHFFNTPHFMAKLGAFLIILWGALNLINEFFPSFPIKLRIPTISHKMMATLMEKATLPTAFILGVFVALCEFPCTGGPYLMVLGLLHDSTTYITGLGYLFFYNLIFVLPLVVILFLASDKVLTEKVREWKKGENTHMRIWGGIAMIILGIIIFMM